MIHSWLKQQNWLNSNNPLFLLLSVKKKSCEKTTIIQWLLKHRDVFQLRDIRLLFRSVLYYSIRQFLNCLLTESDLNLVAVFIVVALAGRSEQLLSTQNITTDRAEDMAMAKIGIAPLSGKYGKDSSGKIRQRW